ncbi:MAG: hypothetical protein N2449_04710 [Bacteroidales bacterium]|nr:hypothetical protein [Bacteroidales bacterium]
MIITGIGSNGGIGVTTLMANLFIKLSELGKDVYWLSLSNLVPPVFFKKELAWLEYDAVLREVPLWTKNNCKFCDTCLKACNCGAMARYGEFYVIYSELCISCSACVYACKKNSIQLSNKRIGFIEQSNLNHRIFRVNLNQREIFSSWHCQTIIENMQKKLPKHAVILIGFPSGFRELWADLIQLSDKIIFYTNDIYTWEMLYKSISHDQADMILAVNSDYYDLFIERGYSFGFAIPHTKEISIEAIQGYAVSDEAYQQVVKELAYTLNV